MSHEYFAKPGFSVFSLSIFSANAYWAEKGESESLHLMSALPLMLPCYFYSFFIIYFVAMLFGVQRYMSAFFEFYLFPLSLPSRLVQYI